MLRILPDHYSMGLIIYIFLALWRKLKIHKYHNMKRRLCKTAKVVLRPEWYRTYFEVMLGQGLRVQSAVAACSFGGGGGRRGRRGTWYQWPAIAKQVCHVTHLPPSPPHPKKRRGGARLQTKLQQTMIFVWYLKIRQKQLSFLGNNEIMWSVQYMPYIYIKILSDKGTVYFICRGSCICSLYKKYLILCSDGYKKGQNCRLLPWITVPVFIMCIGIM